MVPPAYRGSINTWAEMVIQSSYHPDPPIQNVSKVVVPLRVSDTVVNHSSIAKLKADVRVYTPRFMTSISTCHSSKLSSALSKWCPYELVAASHGHLPKLIKEEERWYPLTAALKGNSVTGDRGVQHVGEVNFS